jgi:hypothetical protein
MTSTTSQSLSKSSGISRRIATILAPCALLFAMVGCHQSPEQIGSTVKTSMQETFDKDPNFSPMHFKVDKVVAVKKADTAYDGTATIIYQSKNHDVPVHITLDKDEVSWKTDPGTLDFPDANAPAPAMTPAQ